MSKARIALVAMALLAVALSLLNASWIAPKPAGRLLLVARHGITQPAAERASGECAGVAVASPEHNYLENSVTAMQRALAIGGDVLALPVQRTRDNRAVLFRDTALDCRTDGSGPVAARTLNELKRLDAGYDYTADGGATFPLRGRVGAIQTVEEVLRALPGQRFVFTLGDDPATADAVAADFARAGVEIGDEVGFIAPAPVLARMRRLAPAAWTYEQARSEACLAAYTRTGWTGMMPDACRNVIVALPLDGGWRVWGWPYRFLDRMAGAGSRVMLVAGFDAEGHPLGLQRPEQLAEVPRAFRGFLWVENMYDVGRALQR